MSGRAVRPQSDLSGSPSLLLGNTRTHWPWESSPVGLAFPGGFASVSMASTTPGKTLSRQTGWLVTWGLLDHCCFQGTLTMDPSRTPFPLFMSPLWSEWSMRRGSESIASSTGCLASSSSSLLHCRRFSLPLLNVSSQRR